MLFSCQQVFDDLVSVFDRRSENLLQNNVRVHCANVFPLWITINESGCIKTFHTNDTIKCVNVYESAVFHLDSFSPNSLMIWFLRRPDVFTISCRMQIGSTLETCLYSPLRIAGEESILRASSALSTTTSPFLWCLYMKQMLKSSDSVFTAWPPYPATTASQRGVHRSRLLILVCKLVAQPQIVQTYGITLPSLLRYAVLNRLLAYR